MPQLLAPGRVRLVAPGRLASLGAAAAAQPPAAPQPSEGSFAGLSLLQPQPLPAQAQYQVTVGRVLVAGGTGPFVFTLASSNGRYRVDQGGFVTIPALGDIGLAADTLTVTVADALGAVITRTLPVVKRADASPSLFLEHIGFDDANVSGNPFAQSRFFLRAYGGDHTGADAIDYGVRPADAALFGVQYGNLCARYGGDGPVPPGTYPLHLTAASATQTLALDYDLVIGPVPAIGAFHFSPSVVSTSQPPGTAVGAALATTPTNGRSWTLGGAGAAWFAVDAATGLVTVKATPPAGPATFDLTCTDRLASRTESVTITVQQGVTLPPEAMTLSIPSGLDNWARGQVVGTPVVAGMPGAAAWTLTFHEYLLDGYLGPLFVQDPASGLITAPGLLSARPYELTVIATDGVHTCAQTFSVPVSWVAGGPTLHVGRGMAAAHPGTGFEHLVDVQALFSIAANIGSLRGAQVLVHWDSDENYYAEDNGGGANGSTLGVNDLRIQDGWNGPVRISGVRGPNGERPRVGGTTTAPSGGYDLSGKGFFNLANGEVIIEDFIISHTLGRSTNGTEAMSGVRKNGETYGDCTVRRCALLDNDNGLLGGIGPYRITIDECEIVHAGTALDGEGHGPSHGSYIGHCAELVHSSNLVHSCTYGHNLKVRAHRSTITGGRFYDGERGNASCLIDIPSGGQHVITGNTFHKGPNAQQQAAIQFCAEYDESPTSADPGVNTLLVSGNTFALTSLPYNHFGDAACVRHYVVASHTTGADSSVTFEDNSVFRTPPSAVFSTCRLTPFGAPAADPLDTRTTVLAAMPALDFTRPGPADPSTPRPAYFQYVRDGSSNYVNFDGVQIDTGTDDLRLAVNAPPGTVLCTCAAYGGNGFRNASLSDPRAQPFGPGTVWSVTQAPQWGQGSDPAPWAPASRYVIDASSGVLSVGSGARSTPGVDFIKVRATGPGGAVCDTRLYIVVG